MTSQWLKPGAGRRLVLVATLLVLLPIVISVSLFFAARHYTDQASDAACARVAVLHNVVNREANDRKILARDNRQHAKAIVELSRRTPEPAFRDFLSSEALIRIKTATVLGDEAVYIQAQIQSVAC